MRIIIDTKANRIICPKTFWQDIEKKNDALKAAGVEPLSHRAEVKKYFEEAFEHDLVRAQDLKNK